MQALRKLLYKIGGPDSKHPLALFHHCDIAVIHQMNQLSHLMKTSPDNLNRRSQLIQQLKDAQHNLINVFHHLVETTIPDLQASTEFRIKYSEDVQSNQLFGTIWFGAECLTAGSQIVNHEIDSLELKPYAVRLSKAINQLRQTLREESQQYYYHEPLFTEKVKELLMLYDRCWVEFEFRYVSVMFNVKTETQYLHQQELAVLFSEATERALKNKYFSEDMLEVMDPMVMFAIPRLAIVCGLAINSDGPINPNRPSYDIPKCFKEYNHLLKRIQELMGLLNKEQIVTLEKALCSSDGCNFISPTTTTNSTDSKVPLVSSSVPLESSSVPLMSSSVPVVSSVPIMSPSQEDPLSLMSSSLPSPSSSTDNDNTDTVCSSKDNQPEHNNSVTSSPAHIRTLSEVRSKDLLQRLFIVISGVADQLQSNYPRDFRAIMKQSYTFSLSQPGDSQFCQTSHHKRRRQLIRDRLEMPSDCFTFDLSLTSLMSTPTEISRQWTADSDSPKCHMCSENFSFFRRRHHCRTCGEVVCGQCSPHYLPQLKDDDERLLRVCNTCYIRELGKITHSLSNGTQQLSSTRPAINITYTSNN